MLIYIYFKCTSPSVLIFFTITRIRVHVFVTHLHRNRFSQPLIQGHQRVIGGHFVVNGDRHDGLQVTS